MVALVTRGLQLADKRPADVVARGVAIKTTALLMFQSL
jgi:hypothetical protein